MDVRTRYSSYEKQNKLKSRIYPQETLTIDRKSDKHPKDAYGVRYSALQIPHDAILNLAPIRMWGKHKIETQNPNEGLFTILIAVPRRIHNADSALGTNCE